MTVTELIARLEELRDSVGDLDVVVDDGLAGYEALTLPAVSVRSVYVEGDQIFRYPATSSDDSVQVIAVF